MPLGVCACSQSSGQFLGVVCLFLDVQKISILGLGQLLFGVSACVLREGEVNGWKVKKSSVSSHRADGALWCFDMHLEGVQYVLDGLWSVYFTLFYRSVPGIYRSYRCNSGVSVVYRSV